MRKEKAYEILARASPAEVTRISRFRSVMACQIPRHGGGMVASFAVSPMDSLGLGEGNTRWVVKFMPRLGQEECWCDGILILRRDVHRVVLMSHGDFVTDA